MKIGVLAAVCGANNLANNYVYPNPNFMCGEYGIFPIQLTDTIQLDNRSMPFVEPTTS